MRKEYSKNLYLILLFLAIATNMMAQSFTLHGKVTDENNNPL